MADSNSPKTIQIYLPDGNPQGIRIADLTSRTMKAIQIPRKKLKKSKTREEVDQAGVYYLFENKSEESKPRVYIGQTETIIKRLERHNRKLDFWNTAVAIVSKNQALTKTHIKFLESKSIKQAQEIDRYEIEFGRSSNYPNTPEPMKAELIDNFKTIQFLLATLGFPLFEELRGSNSEYEQIYHCEGKEAKGKGIYVDEGFLILAESKIADHVAPSIEDSKPARLRRQLIESGVIELREDGYIFEEDHLISSPSTASSLVLGNSSNGWKDWKTEDGRTLDDVERE